MNRFLKSFLPAFIFFGTYTAGNSILYFIFKNSYLEVPHQENQLLVFLTAWFSYAEKVPMGTSLLHALSLSMYNWNFGIPAIILTVACFAQYWRPQWLELKITGIQFPFFRPCCVYLLAILSSYAVSLLRWQFDHLKPSTGISIVAVCLLATYPFASFYQFVRSAKIGSKKLSVITFLVMLAIAVSAAVATPLYEGNGLHVAGLIVYFLFALSLSIYIVATKQEPETPRTKS